MVSKIVQPEEFSVLDIFKNSEYIIPIYQRSYAWEKEEIEQLLNDINDISIYQKDENEIKYYLGSLIVDKTSTNCYSVIDGQQRLTTLFLLLCYLDDRTLNSNSLKFEARNKSNITLKELRTERKMEDDSIFSPEIIKGYNVIENYFKTKEKTENGKFKVDDFYSKLANVFIIRTQVPKKIDLNHYFEIMNTRGEQLEIHEVVKGRLLSKITEKEDKIIAALIWDCCSKMDSYIQMNFSPDIRKVLFGDSWNKFNFKNNFTDIKEKILPLLKNSTEQANDTTEQPKDESVFEKLKKRNSLKLNGINDIKEEENEKYESIVSFPNFLLIVNESMQNQGNFSDDSSLDDKRFIKILEKNWANNNTALNFIYNLLLYRYLFDTYVIKREVPKDSKEENLWSLKELVNNGGKPKYQSTLFKADDEENKKNYNNLKMLQSALRITYTSPKTMHWISILLSSISTKDDNSINTKDLVNILEKYCCEKIKNANYQNATGFGIERIIFTYIDYLLIKNGKVDIKNYHFQFRTSIEHFYPQHPSETERWGKEDLDSLGNLALITVSANSRFSNLMPSSKISTYPETINQSPKLKLMSDIMSQNNNWDKDSVAKHKEAMIEMLDEELNRFK